MGKLLKKLLTIICIICVIATIGTISYHYYHDKNVEALAEACYGDNIEVSEEVVVNIEKVMANFTPDSYGEYYLTAILDLKDGNIDQAVNDFVKSTEYLDDEEKIAEAYKKAGTCYGNEGEYEKAMEYFDIALEHSPEDSFALLYEAECYLQLENYPKALDRMERYAKNNALTSSQYMTVIAMCISLEKYEDAIDWASSAMENVPEEKSDFLLYRIQCELLTRDFEKALTESKQYILLTNTNIEPEIMVASMLSTLGMYEDSLNTYLAYIEENPGADVYEAAIEDAYQIDDYDIMMELSDNAIADENVTDKIPYYKWKAISYMQSGKYTLAVNSFNIYLNEYPTHYEVVYLRALCYFTLNQYEAAIADFTACIENDTLVEDSTYNRSLTYAQIGKNDEMMQDLKSVVELNSGSDTYKSAKELLDVLQP